MWDDFDDELTDAMGRDQAGGDAGEHCVITSRYVPSSSPHARQRLQEQVYYLEKRDRHDAEDEDRDLFTGGETGTSRAEARDLVWSNRSTKSVCFHRLILSPSKGLGISTVDDAQAWTRSVMADLGQRLDRELTWVGAVHHNTGRPHVHVLVAGEAAQRGTADGARRVVRIGVGDMTALRERITVDAARPIRETGRARALEAARERQAARMADLDRRLSVPATAGGEAPPPLAPKRRWWQRGK